MVSVKFDFVKRDFVWIGLIIILLSVGFGIAFGGTAPSEMGHSAGELAAPAGCSDGHSLIWDGSSWDCGLGAAGEDRVVMGSFGDYQSTAVGQVGGSSSTLAKNVAYTASTDGFVVAQSRNFGSDIVGILRVEVDGVVRGKASNNGGDHNRDTITAPVKKGQDWEVLISTTTSDYTIFWVPVETIVPETTTFVSPWYSLTKDQVISVPHTLGTKDVVMNVQIKTSDGKIHLFRRGDNCNTHHSATYVDFTTDDSLTLTAGGTGIGFTDHCVNIVTGEVRVLMQKV